MVAVKPKDRKYDLHKCALSHTWDSFSSFTHVPQWVSACVINTEDHSLFIFFRSLNVHSNMSASLNKYLPGPTSLWESNHPSAPQLSGDFYLWSIRRVNLNSIVWTISLTYNGGLTSRISHDLFTWLILPKGTLGYDMTQLHHRYFPK